MHRGILAPLLCLALGLFAPMPHWQNQALAQAFNEYDEFRPYDQPGDLEFEPQEDREQDAYSSYGEMEKPDVRLPDYREEDYRRYDEQTAPSGDGPPPYVEGPYRGYGPFSGIDQEPYRPDGQEDWRDFDPM